MIREAGRVKRTKLIMGIGFFLVLAGCSNQQTYEGLQMSARNECAKSPNQVQYNECMERTKMSYEEYERKRKEQANDPD